MHRSVFGAVIDKTRTFATRNTFGTHSDNRPSIEKVDFGLDRLLSVISQNSYGFIGSLDEVVSICEDVGTVLHETVQNPLAGMEFFARNPKREIPRFVDLLLQSRLTNEPIQIVIPTCPDYGRVGYVLHDGVGIIAEKVLRTLPKFFSFFGKSGFSLDVRIDLADVEAFDTSILSVTGETTASFLTKVSRTRDLITERVLKLPSEGHIVSVGMMSEAFASHGRLYSDEQELIAQELAGAVGGSPARVRDQLVAERSRLGDFDDVDVVSQNALATRELAGYAAYGRLIGGAAIIASPDAASAIPAYHFAVHKSEDFSPVIYIKK